MAQTVLVVEDEPDILALVCLHLRHSGMDTLPCASVEQAQSALKTKTVDLAVIDWMLPGAPGIALARDMRSDPRLRHLPILMLTARDREGDKLEGFDAGVDDYLAKPFSPRELIARIQALLRRSGHEAPLRTMVFRDLILDAEAQRVSITGTPVVLSPTEYRLLLSFMQSPGRVLTRAGILDKVWHDDASIDERTVDVHIRRLRLALKPLGYEFMIETVRGGGYRLALA